MLLRPNYYIHTYITLFSTEIFIEVFYTSFCMLRRESHRQTFQPLLHVFFRFLVTLQISLGDETNDNRWELDSNCVMDVQKWPNQFLQV